MGGVRHASRHLVPPHYTAQLGSTHPELGHDSVP